MKEREKRILESCEEHMERVVATVVSLGKVICAFCGSDPAREYAALKEVINLEREADEVKRGVLDELSKGIFHPTNREEIVRLLLTADDIATNAKAAARKLKLITLEKIDDKLKDDLRVLSDSIIKIVELTSDALESLTKNPRDAIELANEVERVEEDIDDLRMEKIIPNLVSWSDRSKAPGVSMILAKTIDNMENVADRCEDVADVIRSIAISYA